MFRVWSTVLCIGKQQQLAVVPNNKMWVYGGVCTQQQQQLLAVATNGKLR